MLHILLLILKIIGIILAVILGILLLLICIILFVPIRYEISAKCDGTIDSLKAKVKATWLMHFIRADVFVKGTKVRWKVRAAWLKRTNILSDEEREERKKIKEVKDNESAENGSQKVEEKVSETEVHKENPQTTEKKLENDSATDTHHRLEESSSVSQEKKKESFGEKIQKLIEKVKTSISNICDKIKDLLQKKEKITEFLTDESHVRAFHKLKKELFSLLKKLKPKKINIKVRYGFADPCTTGQVLGAIAVFYPLFGDTTEIIPDFENQIIKGTVYLKGRIRFSHFAMTVLKLFLCKDIRTSYKDIRNFKL